MKPKRSLKLVNSGALQVPGEGSNGNNEQQQYCLNGR